MMQNEAMEEPISFGRPKKLRFAAKKALLEQQVAMELIEDLVVEIPRLDEPRSVLEYHAYSKHSDNRHLRLKNRKRRSNNTIQELFTSPVKKARSSRFEQVESLQCLESIDELESPLSPDDSLSHQLDSPNVSVSTEENYIPSSSPSPPPPPPPPREDSQSPCLSESPYLNGLAASLQFYSGEDELEYTWGFTAYEEDIYLFRLSREMKFHPLLCLRNQPQVTPYMRGILVEWLSKLTQHFKFCQETLFLTVNIMDRFLLTTPVSRDCFQLLGITAFLIAAKHEEVTPPDQEELIRLCCNAFSTGQVKQLEMLVLKRLHFDLLAPTSQFFFEHFCATRLRKAYVTGCSKEFLKLTRALGRHMLVQCLQNYSICQHLPSLLACSVLELAHTYLHFSQLSESRHTRLFTRHVLDKCIRHVKEHTIDQISEDEMPTICTKYMSLYHKG